MKTRYRLLARRRLEAPRQLRLRSGGRSGLEPRMDDPIEMPSEVIDLATGELATPKDKK